MPIVPPLSASKTTVAGNGAQPLASSFGGLGENQWASLVLAVLYVVSAFVAFKTESTYDAGDSVYHYLFAHFAILHPENLFNAWAKPLFTLLATVPAQGGFLGMKLFQCTLVAASAGSAFLLARRLRLPWPVLAIVFCYAAPDYFRIQFSGLTEPLFGLVLVGAVVLAAYDRPQWSAALVSWLPFVRSEGYVLLGVWVVYLAVRQQWRALPLLGLGFAAYSLAGGLFLHNFGWVYSSNPYLVSSQYGSGKWTRFVQLIPSLLGWIPTFLCLIGGLWALRRMLRRSEWRQPIFQVEVLLVYGSSVVFIFFHSFAWAMGLFSSFGLSRVLAVLTPLCAVAALSGLAALVAAVPRPQARPWVAATVLTGMVVMLFRNDVTYAAESGEAVGWHSTLHWHRDLLKAPDLILADSATNWLRQHDPRWAWHPLAFEHVYYAMALGVDCFNPAVRLPLARDGGSTLNELPVGTYLFWDSWFCPAQAFMPRNVITQDGRFRQLWSKSALIYPGWPEGGSFEAIVFEKIK